MTPPPIRPATQADAAAIGDLHVRAWQWAYRGLMPDDYLDSLDAAARSDVWAASFGEASFVPPLVATTDDLVVGFCAYGASRDDDATPTSGEVLALYIDPTVVGTGTGSSLWRAALESLREAGHTTCSVWVLETNERGRTFYDHMGMVADGATKTDILRGFPVPHTRLTVALDAH